MPRARKTLVSLDATPYYHKKIMDTPLLSHIIVIPACF